MTQPVYVSGVSISDQTSPAEFFSLLRTLTFMPRRAWLTTSVLTFERLNMFSAVLTTTAACAAGLSEAAAATAVIHATRMRAVRFFMATSRGRNYSRKGGRGPDFF